MEAKLNLNRIDAFIRIVEAGSISKAAQVLQVPKSKLSRHLALLESELGIQLIYRTTRQFQLTDSGLKFYNRSKAALGEIQSAYYEVTSKTNNISGTIRITAPEDFGTIVMIGVVDEFKLLHPEVNFEMFFTNQVLDLVAQRIDLAVRVGNLKDSTMISRSAGTVELILVASPKYLSTLNQFPSIQDLSNLKTVGFVGGRRNNQWPLFSNKFKKIVKVQPHLTMDNFVAIKEFVQLGHGIGFIPRYLCELSLEKGELVQVLKGWSSERQPVKILVPHQKEMPMHIRTFSDFISQKLQSRFA